MQSSSNCICSNDNNCKNEINNAKKFVENILSHNKNAFTDKRDAFTVAHFDLKGSTKLMRHDPHAAITKMLLHNKMCSNIIKKNNGTVIKELGDAVMVTFKNPGLACECAIKIIRNLKKHGNGIRTKVTVASGTLWNIKTTGENDVYGIPVNLCNRMSKHAKENCILFEENAYVSIQNWLLNDKKIQYRKVKCVEKAFEVKCKGDDVVLNDFGPTPMRKIIVK